MTKLDLPSARQPLVSADRLIAPGFYAFLDVVRRILTGQAGPLRLASYTVATLPDVAENAGAIVYVSNGTGNQRIAVSDGTQWRFSSGTIVS